MKKTKIIIPALAALCLGAVASVSGTLAWFSASKSKSVSVDNVAVINTQGSLKAEFGAGKNTTVASSGALQLADGWKLRDASAQLAQSATEAYTVWEALNVDETTGTSSQFQSVNSDLIYNSTKKIGYAATFSVKFYIEGQDTTLYDIVFDAANSSTTITDTSKSAIYGAYRIALYNADHLMVWNDKGTGTTFSYVNSASTATGSYTRTTEAYTLGSINCKDSGSTPIELQFFGMIWFEGTDASCVTSNLAEGVSSAATTELKFYATEHVSA